MTQQKKIAPVLWGVGILALILVLIFWKSVLPKFSEKQQTETEVTVLPSETAPKITLAKASADNTTLETVSSSKVITVGGYTEKELADRGFQLVKGPLTSGVPVGKEGTVYMDMAGNTYERHTLGWRKCGIDTKRGIEYYFVGDTSKPHDIVATYTECQLLGKRLAREMRVTVPFEAKVLPLKP